MVADGGNIDSKTHIPRRGRTFRRAHLHRSRLSNLSAAPSALPLLSGLAVCAFWRFRAVENHILQLAHYLRLSCFLYISFVARSAMVKYSLFFSTYAGGVDDYIDLLVGGSNILPGHVRPTTPGRWRHLGFWQWHSAHKNMMTTCNMVTYM